MSEMQKIGVYPYLYPSPGSLGLCPNTASEKKAGIDFCKKDYFVRCVSGKFAL